MFFRLFRTKVPGRARFPLAWSIKANQKNRRLPRGLHDTRDAMTLKKLNSLGFKVGLIFKEKNKDKKENRQTKKKPIIMIK